MAEEKTTKLPLAGPTQGKPSILERIKTFIGIPINRHKPNVEVRVLLTEERDGCLDELALDQDELLVSDMYQVLEEKLGKEELIVPLDMPERSIPPERLYVFTYCMKLGETWQKEPAEYREGGYVHGRLTKMDVFCVIAELKPEYSTVGPGGGTFVSEKDERITVDFPENAVQKEVKFKILADAVDQKRFKEYQDQNEFFRCIIGFSNILTVLPSTQLKQEASLRLPLDSDFQEEDYKLVCLHWEKKGDEDIVEVLDCNPELGDTGVYNIPVTSFSGHSLLAAKSYTPSDDVIRAARHAIGQLNMCVLMTFVDYDPNRNVNYLLVDCVEFTKADSVAKFHKSKGLTEVKHSRSRDIEIKDKAKIKISITGSFKQQKASAINYFYFHQMARTNHVVVHFTHTSGLDCNIRYYWGQYDHKVYFSLDEMEVQKLKKRPKTTGPSKNVPKVDTNKQSKHDKSREAGIQRQVSIYPDLHPTLTDKSLAALAHNLPLTEWRDIGLELNFTTDQITTIFEKAEKKNSKPALELLMEWRGKNMSRPQKELIEDLTATMIRYNICLLRI